MAKVMVHLTHGPEHPTRVALAFLVAKAAVEEGHQVTVFLAGDAVQLLRDATLDAVKGVGTGDVRQLYEAVVAGQARIFVSKLSANARGLGPADLEGKPAEFATPNRLVQLSLEHDRMFTY
jgi:uncharacterized protein